MNFVIFLLLIRMITYFLDGLLVIIWICSLALGMLLTMFWIWLIFFILKAGKVSLILTTSDVLVLCLEVYIYDFWGCFVTLASLIFLKYLEIWLTSFGNLTEIGGNFLDTCWDQFVDELVVSVGSWWYLWSKFYWNFLS